MKKLFTADKWEYEVTSDFQNKYGYEVTIYKNNMVFKVQGGFGSIGTAESWATRYFLSEVFNISDTWEE